MSRRILTAFLLTTVLVTTAFAADVPTRPYAPVQQGYVPTAPDVPVHAPGRVMVQFTEDAYRRSALVFVTQKNAEAPSGETGLPTVDAELARAGAKAVAKAYRGPAAKADRDELGVDRWFRVDVPNGTDVPALAATLAALPEVEHANPDWVAFPAATPNDPMYANNWGHDNTVQLPGFDWGGTWDHTLAGVGTAGFDANADLAWDFSQAYGDPSVVIAILDSGVDSAHLDLNQVAGYDYGDNDSNPHDDSAQAGHGTACAGVAAGVADNSLGVAGVAGGCSIMPLKIANSAGTMYFSYIIDAIYHAADNGADVISMSFGAAISSDPATNAALQYAWNAGCVNLAATGNENDSTISYPAINSNVIAVGAASPCGDRKRSSSDSGEVNPGINTDPNGYTCDGERWWGSNYGSTSQNAASAVDIIAPTILPTTDISGGAGYSNNDYSSFFNGTSCATPYAAGVAALIRSAEPALTPSEIRTRLRDTALDVVNVESGAGWDRYSGYGMIDAQAAIAAGGTGPAAPSASFTGDPLTGCAPLAVDFTDATAGDVTSWAWDFGDGSTSTQQNPTHTYTTAGTYTVTLTATGPGGSDTLVRTNYVTADPRPGADFTAGTTTGTAPLSVFFVDSSTESPTSWHWDFGDGGTSTAQFPLHTFTAPGSYDVTLIATNACGPDTIVKPGFITVTAPAPTAAFSADATDVCVGASVGFTDDSTGSVTSWAWDFGDGATSTDQNPSHAYALPGTYTVALTVTGPGGSDTATQTDLIAVSAGPTADFTASTTTGLAPLDVDFTDLSTGAPASWAWDFGDGGTSTQQNPTHTYAAAGTYTVKLTVTGTCGVDSLVGTGMIEVTAPTAPSAAFSVSPVELCAPGDATFTDASTGDVTDWAWDFGDGGTSTLQNPVHTYAAPGAYDVTLIVTGPAGADTLSQAGLIQAGAPLAAGFSSDVATGFVPLTVAFTDTTTGGPTAWEWNFGDGSPLSFDQNPVHTYTLAGTFTVTLTASNGCGDDVVQSQVIVTEPVAPVAAFTAADTAGCTPFLAEFADASLGDVDAWHWDFGDGAIDTIPNPTHEYVAAGDYDVTLIVTGPAGADTLTRAGYIHVEDAVSASVAASVLTGPAPLTVDFTSSVSGAVTGWLWDFGDATTDTVPNPTHTYAADGTYNVSLTVQTLCGPVTAVLAEQIVVDSTTDIAPRAFALERNVPNPFNPATVIAFSLEREDRARLEVFDAAGRSVETLVDGVMPAGRHEVLWQPTRRPSGVYFARLTANGRTATQRMVLVK